MRNDHLELFRNFVGLEAGTEEFSEGGISSGRNFSLTLDDDFSSPLTHLLILHGPSIGISGAERT